MAQVDRLWEFCAGRRWEGVYLINNAASNLPMGAAERGDAVEVMRAVQVNLTAAMLLTNSFIRVTQGMAPDRRVLNISSGAGRRPVAWMSTYCATKSGLDLYTQCVALEQAERADGVRIASIAPGIIDTDMQTSARSATEEEFPGRQQFVDYYEKGELATPAAAAAKLIRILHSDAVHRGELLNIRDFA
jgi:benzil reductase ((S)-benzoin forming)